MKQHALVTSRLVRFMLWRLAQLGRPTSQLLRSFGLPAEAATLESVKMTLPHLAAFGDAAATLADDDVFGLTLVNLLPRGHYGALEFAARTAETMGAALETMLQTQGLPGEPIRFSVTREDGGPVTIRQTFEGHSGGMGRHGNEFSMATLIRAAREIVGEPFHPRRVWFAHPRPAEIAPLVRFFATEDLAFSAPDNGLTFDAAWLDAPAKQADPPLHEVLRRQLPVQRALEGEATGGRTTAAQRVVEDLLATGGALITIERVAARLGCSGRSLQRELAQGGRTFRELLETARMQIAERWLRESDEPVATVAERVGFHDARSFARAFRRWSGKSPVEFRRTSDPKPEKH